jgi:hypothetical protein
MNQELRIKEKKFFKQIADVILIGSLASCFLLLAPQTNAQTMPRESLRITPIINDLKLIPGKPTTIRLTVENISQNPVGIHAEINGLDVLGDAPQSDQPPSKMVNWTILSTNDLLLGAKQKQIIIVTINTPINIKQNGYYETIFLTPITHQQDYPSSPIILSRIGVLVLGTVGNLNYDDLAKKVSVTNFIPIEKILNTFPSTISFTVANKYFSHFDAKPFITVTPLFANSQTVELTDKHVLPDSEIIWQYMPTVAKNHIFYQVHLAISVGGGKQIFTDEWFIVLPYEPVAAIIIILILLYISIAKRKRLGKFVKILLKG